MSEVGFIVLRHVNNERTNNYWINCIRSIRQYYPNNKILIIDDNSNYDYITKEDFYNTTIINSAFPKRGELLPYYYYLHNKLFDIAVIIHDSVFINKYIDFNTDTYTFIWEFEDAYDHESDDELRIISVFENKELIEFYKNKHLWKGCFGCMTIIKHDYLTYINSKYDISKLLDCILTRHERCCLERVIACIFQKEGEKNTLLGNIHYYCPWGICYEIKDNYRYLPIIKCWTGR